jgi:RNA polymerase sigma-70 factor (ECF subfamily)
MARSIRDFRSDASVSSWLYTIARRYCIKQRRRSTFAPTREESLDTPGSDVGEHPADPRPNPEQTATNRELATALTHAIEALEPAQREVLILRDVEGLSAPEVATILGRASLPSRAGCIGRGSPSARTSRRHWDAQQSHRSAERGVLTS